MKKVVLFVLIFILMLGGCGGMQNKDETKKGSVEQSDAAALQDEFTSEFIDTSVEVEEGYLQFKSKTSGYTMLYPKDAIAHPTVYETNGDRFELLKYGTAKKDKMSIYVNASYEVNKNTKETELYLDMLSDSMDYKGEYEKVDSNNITIHLATDKFISEDRQSSIFSVFGFIQSKNSDQSITYDFNLVCDDEQNGCSYEENEVKKEVLKLMKSITFVTPEE
jgi:hypothetical protein